MKKNILWVSKHNPIPKQIKELKKLHGEQINLIQLDGFRDVNNILDHFYQNHCHDMVIVAPLSVIMEINKRGIRPLWSEMEPALPGTADTTANGRYYKFKGFKRLKKIKIEFCDPKQPIRV